MTGGLGGSRGVSYPGSPGLTLGSLGLRFLAPSALPKSPFLTQAIQRLGDRGKNGQRVIVIRKSLQGINGKSSTLIFSKDSQRVRPIAKHTQGIHPVPIAKRTQGIHPAQANTRDIKATAAAPPPIPK